MKFSEFTPTERTERLLQRAEANQVARRSAEAEQLLLARDWAYAHQCPELRGDVREIGAARLRIWEFAPAELALAWEIHPLAAQKVMADAVDLSQRMPGAWAAATSGRLPVWVARKIARAAKDLPGHLARQVDEELHDDYATLPPGRLLGAAEGRIAAVAPADLDERARGRLGHLLRPARRDRRGPPVRGVRRLAELLDRHNGGRERLSRDQLRAQALGYLADPQAALDLLHERDPRRGKAVVYVHMTPRMFDQRLAGIARVEDLGPHSREMLRRLLGHDQIILKPVLDLSDDVSSDAYEIPAGLAERIHLIKPADTFPWAESTSRRVDLDHTVAWPRGPSTLGNLGKMVRRHHRIKTHGGWSVHQLPGDRYVWRSPHGRYAVVDPHGTHQVDLHKPTTLERRFLSLIA